MAKECEAYANVCGVHVCKIKHDSCKNHDEPNKCQILKEYKKKQKGGK